jgi:hypothetical protein
MLKITPQQLERAQNLTLHQSQAPNRLGRVAWPLDLEPDNALLQGGEHP